MALLRKIDQYTSGNSQVKYLKFFKEICTMIHLLPESAVYLYDEIALSICLSPNGPLSTVFNTIFSRMLPTAAFGNSCTWKMEYMHLLHVFWLIFLDVQGSYQCFCYDRGYSKVSLQTQNFRLFYTYFSSRCSRFFCINRNFYHSSWIQKAPVFLDFCCQNNFLIVWKKNCTNKIFWIDRITTFALFNWHICVLIWMIKSITWNFAFLPSK